MLVKEYYDNYMKKSDGKRLVILRRVYPDVINRGYQNLQFLVLLKVNGRPVDSLADLKKALSLESGYDVFEFRDTAFKVVFRRNEAAPAMKRIRETYSVTLDEYIP